MTRFNAWNVFRNGLTGQKGWNRQWRDPEPRKHYDVIIVGGGLHGLATAYYLAKNHSQQNIAVVEKGCIGGGNAGRNTTLVRSDYTLPGNREFYEFSLKLWENLSHELNYNVMFSQRGYLSLMHSPGAVETGARVFNTMRLTDSDGEYWDLATLKREIPFLAYDKARFPIHGAFVQKRAGTARHDAVVWGYARAASALGVDILQKCEVCGIERNGDRIAAVETSRGRIECKKIAFSVAGSTSRLWHLAGLNSLPIESHLLQAFVTEPIKPVLNHVVTFVVGGLDFYISQSDKGGLVFGSGLDGYKSYTQRGSAHIVTETARSAMSILPNLGRARLLRHWGGLCDMSMDGSHFMCRTPLENLYLNAGWNYGGFKATPAAGWFFADLIYNGRPARPIERHTLERFRTGDTIDESGLGPNPKLHG